MYVWVAGFHPSVAGGFDGGFEWRYNRKDALRVLIGWANEALKYDIDGGHNLVFAKIEVPFDVELNSPEIDPADRYDYYRKCEADITYWLDNNLELFELPLQS